MLYGTVKADLALTGGVHGATDVIKSMMAGAKIAMMTSALLKRGISYLDTIATELLVWMGEHEYDSIKQMQGSMSRNAVPHPGAFERANYMKVLSSYAPMCFLNPNKKQKDGGLGGISKVRKNPLPQLNYPPAFRLFSEKS